MYAREDCWPVEENCPDHVLEERVIVNPIYNYQTIKRLAVYFRDVEKAVGEVDFDSECSGVFITSLLINCNVVSQLAFPAPDLLDRGDLGRSRRQSEQHRVLLRGRPLEGVPLHGRW